MQHKPMILLSACLLSSNLTLAHAETTNAPVIGYPSTITPTTPTPPPATPSTQQTVPTVSRGQFTTGLNGREPIDRVSETTTGKTLYYFTEVSGLQGHVITHKWERDGVFQLGLQFPIGGDRWRIHSSKSITSNLAGTWKVTIQNDDGTVLRQDTILITPSLNTPTTTPTNQTTPNIKPNIPAPSQPLTTIPPELQKTTNEKPTETPKTNSEDITTKTDKASPQTEEKPKNTSEEKQDGTPSWSDSAIKTTKSNSSEKPTSAEKPSWETLPH